MKAFYKLIICYPDGHFEELDEVFRSIEDAKKYGLNLLGQILHTEGLRGGSSSSKKEAYFTVEEYLGKEHNCVYDSRNR